MKKKFTVGLLVLLATAVLFVGCTLTNSNVGNGNTIEQDNKGIENDGTIVFTDSTGRSVVLPERIDSIAPSGALAQMVLFSLAPDKLAGLAGKWSKTEKDFIDQKYLELPVFGQLYGSGDLNMEELAKASPQLIIDIGEPKDGINSDMEVIEEKLGIPTIHVDASLETMDECYTILGKILGLEKEAEVLSDYCNEVYMRTVDGMKNLGSVNKKSILYCMGDTGTRVIAKGSYHAQVIDILAENVAVVDNLSGKGSGNEVSMEQILLWEPDVIIFSPGSIYNTVGHNAGWNTLKAISSQSFYEVPCGPYNWMGFPPSVNRFIGMVWLSKLLYPSQFAYDLFDESVRYYRLFYHMNLTRQQFDMLVKNAF